MEILVDEIMDNKLGELIVHCSTKYGKFKAIWKDLMPEMGKLYHGEIDIPQILIWGNDINESISREYKIVNIHEYIYINCKFESLDQDNICTFRLGSNLFLLETQGNPLSLGGYVSIKTNKLYIYDSNI